MYGLASGMIKACNPPMMWIKATARATYVIRSRAYRAQRGRVHITAIYSSVYLAKFKPDDSGL